MENKEIIYEIKYSKIKNIYIQIKEGKVIVKAPEGTSKNKIEKIIKEKQNWIRNSINRQIAKNNKKDLYSIEEFKNVIENQFEELIKMTGLSPNKITIKKLKSAWGSCSNNKNITINLELIKYSKKAIRYVILHELCHLKYMNHSERFWNLIQKYMPDYKTVRKEFK